jgi:hypothetical protein
MLFLLAVGASAAQTRTHYELKSLGNAVTELTEGSKIIFHNTGRNTYLYLTDAFTPNTMVRANRTAPVQGTDVTAYLFTVKKNADGTFSFVGHNNQYIGECGRNQDVYTKEEAQAGKYTVTLASGSTNKFLLRGANGEYMNGKPETLTGWGGTGGNSQYEIFVPEVEEVTYAELRYQAKKDGQVLASTTAWQKVGSAPVIPEAIKNPYVTLTTDKTTVSATDEEVNFTASYNAPFQFSADAEHATWYYLQLRPASNKSYLSADTENKMMGQADKFNTAEFKWAFVGNPYAVKVINKATGDEAALAYEDAVKVARPGSPIKVVAGSSMAWVLCKNGDNGFTLRSTENASCYLHNRVDDGITTLSASEWGGVASDEGSTFKVTEAPLEDDYNTQLIADFSSWFDVETTPTLNTYFTLSTSDYNTLKAQYTTLKATCTSEQYEGFVENFYHAVKYPETGYYFLKSTAGGQYGYMSSDGVKVYGNTAKTGVNTVVYLEKHEDEGFVYYTIKIQDKYVNRASQSSEVGMSATAQTPYMADIFKPGVISLTANPNDPYAFLHVSAGNQYALVGWKTINDQNQPINASLWTVEDATSFEVPLNAVNGKSYATFCAPFGVTVADTKANTLVMDASKKFVTLNEIAEVPANTGVLLVNETGATTATVTIKDDATATVANNALVGTLAPHAKEAGDLFLGNNEGVVGFYDWAGTSLVANRAYIPAATAAGVRALLFDNTTTGVNAATLNNASQKVFDLQGRRVEKAQKGLYIVNGKKVVL